MNLHELHGPPSAELAQKLRKFQTRFRHPLPRNSFYRVFPAGDYTRLYCSLGEACCLVAERDGEVIGSLGAALTPLLMPDGSERRVFYVLDVLLVPSARKGTALFRMLQRAWDWARPHTSLIFSLALDKTEVKPSEYTGRLGLPKLEQVGRFALCRIPTATARSARTEQLMAPREAARACYRELCRGRYAMTGPPHLRRSQMTPVWFMQPDGSACGRLEDRWMARRLIRQDGTPLKPCYLSCFAFRAPEAGLEILLAGLRHAAQRGYHFLYVALEAGDAEALGRMIPTTTALGAPGGVYAHGFAAGPPWNINSAEM